MKFWKDYFKDYYLTPLKDPYFWVVYVIVLALSYHFRIFG